jgi:hypothetical protein
MLKSRRNPINFVTVLPASLSYQCSVMSNQSEAASVFCKPIRANLLPISKHRENYNSLSDNRIFICTSVNTTWRTAGLIQDFMEHADPTPNFFYLKPILRPFRIVRCNRRGSITFSPVQLYCTCNWRGLLANHC